MQDLGEADVDVGDATDEQMFLMDAKLAAYFSTLRDSRSGTKSNRQDLCNFKMRVLALLEAFIKRAPTSPLLLALPVPLLTALATASKPGGDQALAERLAGLIQHRLCKSRPGSAELGPDNETLAAQLRRAMYLASRAPDKRVAAAAADVTCTFRRPQWPMRTLQLMCLQSLLRQHQPCCRTFSPRRSRA